MATSRGRADVFMEDSDLPVDQGRYFGRTWRFKPMKKLLLLSLPFVLAGLAPADGGLARGGGIT